MKKGKVTDVEISCLKGMLSDNISVADMAQQLDRSSGFIKKDLIIIANINFHI